MEGYLWHRQGRKERNRFSHQRPHMGKMNPRKISLWKTEGLNVKSSYNQQGLIPGPLKISRESQKGKLREETKSLPLKRRQNKQPHWDTASKPQLENSCGIWEWDLFTNMRTCVGGTGILGKFLQEQRRWWASFHSPSPQPTHVTPVGTSILHSTRHLTWYDCAQPMHSSVDMLPAVRPQLQAPFHSRPMKTLLTLSILPLHASVDMPPPTLHQRWRTQ